MIGGNTEADKNRYEDYVFVFFTDRSQICYIGNGRREMEWQEAKNLRRTLYWIRR